MNRIAAIDIGTNSFHLIVVELKDSGSFDIIDRVKEVIRLGEGSKGDIKIIQPQAVERAVDTLKRFKGISESHNAEIRAIATSAVRESINKIDVLKKIYKETGIEIEVVSGNEEARLIYLGMLKAVPIYNETVCGIDIGGGSTEFIVGNKGNIRFSHSLKIGTVRLTQKFFPDFNITKEGIKLCRKWVDGEVFHIYREVSNHDIEKFVGSSGTILAAGLMIHAQRKSNIKDLQTINNFEYTAEELFELEEKILSKKTPAERKKIKGLDPARADIIPAGIIIISEIFRKLNIKKITLSDYALREGIVVNSIRKAKDDYANSKLSNIRADSIKNLAESCKFDRSHCRHVADLSLQIFDQTKKLHGLSYKERELLDAASRLHDIGYHIAHSQHHRHSMYIIKNSDLLGYNEQEIQIIANVARYHRKSHPKNSHKDYISLPSKNMEIVKKLSAILRISDSLDRTHYKLVKAVSVNIKNKYVEIHLETENGLPEIELWSLDRRKALFEEVFNKSVKIVN